MENFTNSSSIFFRKTACLKHSFIITIVAIVFVHSFSFAQCNTGNQVSSAVHTPNYSGFEELFDFGSPENGKYYKVNVLANRFYTFYTYEAGNVEAGYQDFITIVSATGNFLAFGPSPLVFQSFDYTGEIRYYFHSNSACQTSNVNRWPKMMSSTSLCMPPTNLNETNLTSNSVTLNWDEQNPLPSNGYQYYIVLAPGPFGSPMPPGNTPDSGVTGFTLNTSVTLNNLSPNSRYFYWVRSNCGDLKSVWMEGGMFTTPTLVCNSPTGLSVSNVTANSALFTWQPPSPVPSGGYHFAYNTTGTTPTSANEVYTLSTSQFLSGLSNNTTYYYFVRSDCGSILSPWVFGGNFTTPIGFSCNSALYGLKPAATYTPTCTGSMETINSDARAGEYANVAVQSNKQYTFASSIASDYITITNATGSILYATGASPLVWESGASNETVRFFLHTNSSCGTNQTNRSRTISCAPSTNCAPPTNLTSFNVGSTQASISWTASPSNPPVYDVYFSTSASAPNSSTPPDGFIDETAATLNNLTPATTYYFWVRSDCGAIESVWVYGGSFTTTGGACNPPSNLVTSNITTNSATISWTAASPTPIEYDVYFSTSSTAPTASTTPVGSLTQTAADLINLTAGTTYYYWVRSDCGATQSAWVYGGSFTTTGGACNPPSNLVTSNITTNSATISWTAASPTPTEYDVYFSTSSTAPTASTTPVGSLTQTAADLINLTAGTTYYYWVRSDCGATQSAWVYGGSFTTIGGGPCNPPSNLEIGTITGNSAQIAWTAASPAPVEYDVYFSTSSTPPNAATTPVGSLPGTEANLINLTDSTTYYFWVRSDCGGTQSAWVYGGSFTTANITACLDAVYGQYPENQYTPNCTGNDEVIVTDAYASEFSFVDVYPGKTYTFKSGVATDYITIGSGDGLAVYTSGTTPLEWQSGNVTDVVRFFIHTNSSCGAQNTNRVKSVRCTNTLGVDDNVMEQLTLYPNPTKDVVQLFNATAMDRVEVYNMLGQLVHKETLNADTGTIHMEAFSAGTYFVKVFVGTENQVMKIIKE